MIQNYLPLVILIIVATGLGTIALIIGILFGPRRPTKAFPGRIWSREGRGRPGSEPGHADNKG